MAGVNPETVFNAIQDGLDGSTVLYAKAHEAGMPLRSPARSWR
jgi:hypothetical protein